jgi:hypothetical protein
MTEWVLQEQIEWHLLPKVKDALAVHLKQELNWFLLKVKI